MNENESAAPFSFIGTQFDFARPELLTDKELMCLLPIVWLNWPKKRLRRHSPNSLA